MQAKWFSLFTIAFLLFGIGASASGFAEVVERIGAAMVAVAAMLVFFATKPSSSVFLEGKPAVKFEISPEKLTFVAALTVSGTVLWGFSADIPKLQEVI
ncbi:hypothetical protein DQW77_15865 [Roseovarius sp. TE539]|uniref:hypothetical protein n=1 Tax=Roseovarius sp. TE539 TaxID=2249812 RepID=UPI000DDF6292|nr:hypothetical protein [Roseovarius sp. TE539]RBI69086.1 hypothetical protein DQW77_15865 [Roseovarius sp. TE539]